MSPRERKYLLPEDNLPPLDSWWKQAACRGIGPTLWFSKDKSQDSLRIDDEAKAICRGCEVQRDCLEYALKYKPQGIWGGTTEPERRRLLRRSRRRPAGPISTVPGSVESASRPVPVAGHLAARIEEESA